MLRTWIARAGPALGLVVVVLVFALLTDAPARYLSSFNLRIVLSQTVIVALGAIGIKPARFCTALNTASLGH